MAGTSAGVSRNNGLLWIDEGSVVRSDIQRVAIAGSSGYLRSRLIHQILHDARHVLGLDIKPPREPGPHVFFNIDVRSPDLKDFLTAFRPDTVVHLAFIVNPIHDEVLMRDINVYGSRNVFDAVRHSTAQRFRAASSATVYGTWPDDPVPLDDDASAKPRRILVLGRQSRT